MNIDDLFSGVTKEKQENSASAKVLAENIHQISGSELLLAEPEFSHMFVFKVNVHNILLFKISLALTCFYHYTELSALFDAVSTSEVKSYFAYSAGAEKFVSISKTDDEKSDDETRQLFLEIRELCKKYDLIKCPYELVYKINKDYIDYHYTTENSVSELYIIFKCNLKCNMQRLLRTINSIRNASEQKSEAYQEIQLKILYNDKMEWMPISKGFVNLEYIKEVWEKVAYKKNLEDKFVFLYKDMFYQNRKTSDELEFNRRLIYDFKDMIRKRQNKKIERNWKKVKSASS